MIQLNLWFAKFRFLFFFGSGFNRLVWQFNCWIQEKKKYLYLSLLMNSFDSLAKRRFDVTVYKSSSFDGNFHRWYVCCNMLSRRWPHQSYSKRQFNPIVIVSRHAFAHRLSIAVDALRSHMYWRQNEAIPT